ncbi:MAG TPA: OB-fold nucleic acid binding domain-containing protein, partial [Nitrospirota bacterium]
MPGDELKTILDRIKKPLAFAGRDNFAHLKSLTALEPFMRAQVADLKRVTEDRPESSVIEDLFSGFDSLDPEKKKDRILKASEVIDALERSQEPPVSQSQSKASFATTQSSEHPLRLDTPVQYCKGVGPKRAEMLAKLGIATVEDAITYLPWRYEDRGNLKKIGRLAYGSYETVSGEVVSAEIVQTKRQRVKVFELLITDRSGMLIGSWFNQPFMKKMFRPGQKVILSGVVKSNPYKGGLPQIDNPDYEIMEEHEADDLIHTGRTVPIYRTTAGLSVRYLRSMIKAVLDSFGTSAQDAMPGPLVEKYALMAVPEAYFEAHFPTKEKDLTVLNRGTSAAHRRMSFEELFALELGLALRKRGVTTEKKG